MASEVPQTLEYRGGQLNAAPLLETIIENGPFIPMIAGQRNHVGQWTSDERKAANLDQRLKKLRPTKDFEAKYNKVKAKLAFLSSSASASKASMVKNKSLIAEVYEWDKEEVSSDDNEMVKVKVLMALAEDNNAVSKEGARNEITETWLNSSNKVNQCVSEQIPIQKNILRVDQLIEDPFSSGQKDLVCGKSSANDTKVSIPGVEKPLLSKAEETNYDSDDESSIYSTPLPSLKKLEGVEHVSGSKTVKSALKSRSTFKAEALKGVIINEPSSAHAKGNKSTSALKNSASAVVLETEVSSDQNGQADQNDQPAQADEILNDDQFEHSNDTNDEQNINNLSSTEEIQISEHILSKCRGYFST
ncbi:hypothetical protein Tco_1090074 [Tanacetum coccineum]|uniref:Uncharacterized protein n=1 Tax=Tanacetum coccineum TaxID=301880 RepID=A0ABQ5I4A5_9ASTR